MGGIDVEPRLRAAGRDRGRRALIPGATSPLTIRLQVPRDQPAQEQRRLSTQSRPLAPVCSETLPTTLRLEPRWPAALVRLRAVPPREMPSGSDTNRSCSALSRASTETGKTCAAVRGLPAQARPRT